MQKSIAASRAGQKIYWEGETIENGATRFSNPEKRFLSLKRRWQQRSRISGRHKLLMQNIACSQNYYIGNIAVKSENSDIIKIFDRYKKCSAKFGRAFLYN